MNTSGKFIISLDFELLWGMRDIKGYETYGENILGVWETLPSTLELFEKYGIRATFATVGFLFASTKKELMSYCPDDKPNYVNKHLSPYNGHFGSVGENEEVDKYHFASQLIDLILEYHDQEIGTHTFCHYYCLEKGQSKQSFKEDILAAIKIAKDRNIELKSLVFPRNQFNDEYLEIIKELGIDSYRGNGKEWFNKASNKEEEKLIKRAFRFLNTYLNIAGHGCYTLKEIAAEEPFDIPSSRFLRPYSTKLRLLEGLRLRRILKSMEYAAKTGKIYHLWWHPHNFGTNQKDNLDFLNKILAHYKHLHENLGFESLTMNNLSKLLHQEKAKAS